MELLKPLKVGNVTFKNRVMFPPLTTGYEEKDGSVGEQSLAFYTRLAKGGVGYIVLGDVVPVPTFSPTPKLFMDSQIDGFKRLADTLHQYDCKVGLQVFHPEYDAETLSMLFRQGKMDEARAKLHHDMLYYINEVTKEQLEQVLEKIKACVIRMRKANIDVVEIHGDRLVGALCSKILNKREDEFGGSFENRTRFALMMFDAIKSVSGDMLIEYKLPIVTKDRNGNLIGKGGLELDEAVKLAKLLDERGIDMIHVAQANHTGNMNDTIPAMGTRDYAFMLSEAKAIREAVSCKISVVGRLTNAFVGEALVSNGTVDMVAFGRSLLTDPDIVNKLAENKPNLIRHCIMCNKGCTDAISSRRFLSCVLNAENGYEATRQIKKAEHVYNVAVVGAGVAGLEAARVLKLKGHNVTVYEKSLKVGGQINIAKIPPRKMEMERILNYYEENLKELNVPILLNTEFKKEMADNYDYVVVATGATNACPPIKGIDGKNVVSSWDLLANKQIVVGDVIICGGGLVGCETAEYLAEKGYNVSVVEMMDKIAKEESSTVMPSILASFKEHDVKVYTSSKIKEMSLEGVKVDKLDKDGNVIGEEMIRGDFIVTALTSRKNPLVLEGVKAKVVYVGDCKDSCPNNIENAIKSSYDACNAIN